MKKDDVSNSIEDSRTYRGTEVRNLVQSVTVDVLTPFYLQFGDVILANVGRKRRPVVVVKVVEDLVMAIPLTTTEDSLSLGSYDSRFLGKGSFTKQIISLPLDYAVNNYFTILNDEENLNLAFEQIKEFFKNNL